MPEKIDAKLDVLLRVARAWPLAGVPIVEWRHSTLCLRARVRARIRVPLVAEQLLRELTIDPNCDYRPDSQRLRNHNSRTYE